MYGINHSEFCSGPCIFLRHKCFIPGTSTSFYGMFNSIVAFLAFFFLMLIFLRRWLLIRQARTNPAVVQRLTNTVTILPLHVIFLFSVSIYTGVWFVYNLAVPHGWRGAVPLLLIMFVILLCMLYFLIFYMMQRGWGGKALKNAAILVPIFVAITSVAIVPGVLAYEGAIDVDRNLPYYFGPGYPTALMGVHSTLLILTGCLNIIPLMWKRRLAVERDRDRTSKALAFSPAASMDRQPDTPSTSKSSISRALSKTAAKTRENFNKFQEFVFKHTHPRRNSIFWLTTYVMVLQFPFLAGAILLYFEVDAGSCIWQGTMSLLQMGLAPMLYFVLHSEAKFLKKVALGPLVMDTADTFRFRANTEMGEKGMPTYLSSSYVVDQVEMRKGNLLGKGAAAEVFRGTLRGKPVAMKRYYREIYDEDMMKENQTEALLLSTLDHSNVVRFEGISFQPPYYFMLTELCENGNLADLLDKECGTLTNIRMLEMCLDIANGMNYLHSRDPPILHNDLKTQNLLVDEKYMVKVCDLDISGHETGEDKRILSTVRYSAPEMLKSKGREVSTKTDVYAFGVIVYEMFATIVLQSRPMPFSEFGRFDAEIEDAVICGKRPTLPSSMPRSIKSLVEASWHDCPDERPSFKEVCDRLENMVSRWKRGSVLVDQD